MKQEQKNPIDLFWNYLFWDVYKSEFDIVNAKVYFIERVVILSSFEDYKMLQKLYGMDVVLEVIIPLRCLEAKTLSFFSSIYGIYISKCRCS